MALPASAVFIGVALSAVVGLFFGIYPARRAAQARSDRSAEVREMTLNSFALAASSWRWPPSGSTRCASFLTVLGVIIGTGTVIGVGSIIAGLDGAITNILRSFGPNTIIVLKARAMGDRTPEERRRKPLTLEKARAIEERCPRWST